MVLLETARPTNVFISKNLLYPDLRNRDPKNRFDYEEKKLLAINIREAWGVSPERRNTVPLVSFESATEAGNYKDTEHYVLKSPDLPRLDRLDVITNFQTPQDVQDFRAVIDELDNPQTTLATMFFPLQRGDRPKERLNGKIEVLLLRRLIRDLSVSNIRRLIVSASHSPAFSYFALEAGIAVIDVIPLPAMFDAAVEKGLFQGKTIVPVTSDYGAGDMGKVVEELAEERGILFEPTIHGKKTKIHNITEVSFPEEELVRVKGKVAVIPEDILATGGTLNSTASQLLEAGAEEAVILVTYPIFAGEALQRLGNKKRVTIITTDGKTPLVNITDVRNIIEIPIFERFTSVLDLDRQGIDFWSEDGEQGLKDRGFCLNPWMDIS